MSTISPDARKKTPKLLVQKVTTMVPFRNMILMSLALCLTTAGQQPLPSAPRKPPLLLGAAWYPEQWPESRWDADLSLMEEAHIGFVRVGEFAWSTLEPSEGRYDLDWLNRAIRAAEKHHIAVVLGTPSAAPPAWLTTTYPETLRTKEDGQKDEHGNRQQFDFSDPKYRQLSREMAEKMAERFGHDPNVIGWQIDNEYKNESYGANTRNQFQDWLRAKYKTLDNLNASWTTAYWSQTYQDWHQIPIAETRGNPGLLLNWKEFVSDTWRSYQRNQLDVIRAHADRRQFITTNMMGWFNAYDHYTVSKDLDIISWDDYVGSGHLNPVSNGARHDLNRGFLQKNFWVMETQPGSVNWSLDNNVLDKGEVRAMAWNAVGHGAEAVEYWQWRSALNGQEQYHGVLVGPDGTPLPLYEEVVQIGQEFEKAAPALTGTSVESQVALIYDYDSRWAIEWQPHNRKFDYLNEFLTYYRGIRRISHSVDVVSDTTSLDRYKLVIAPALNVLTPKAAKNLEAYVRGGGHLILGQRSGMKDANNSLWAQRQPGPLAKLLGARVEQFYALTGPVPISGVWGNGEDGTWADQIRISSPETQVLMRYGKSNGWLDSQPAAVTRRVGAGSITYIGTQLSSSILDMASQWMRKEANLDSDLPEQPSGIDVAIRSGNGKCIYILTNYSEESKTVRLPTAMQDVLDGGRVSEVTLKQYGVAVIER
jgi:beta-galactosidase